MRRQLRTSRRRGRGIALVLTLFTVTIIVTLTASFVLLASNESKTSKGEKDAKLAYQLATAGIDATIHYMSSNSNWVSLTTVPDPYTGETPSFALADQGGQPPSGHWQAVSLAAVQKTLNNVPISVSTLQGVGPTGFADSTFAWHVVFNNGSLTTFPIDGNVAGNVDVQVQRVGVNPGDPNTSALKGDNTEVYYIQATSQVFPVSATSGTPLATRTVLARVRDSGTSDNSLITIFGQSFDAPGLNKQFQQIAGNNTTNAADALNQQIGQLAQVGGIPFGATTTGQVTVIGTSNGPLASSAGTLRIFGEPTDFLNGGTPPTLKTGITTFSKNVSTASPIIFDSSSVNSTDQKIINSGLFAGGNQTTGAPGIPGTAAGSGGINATTQIGTDGTAFIGNLSKQASIATGNPDKIPSADVFTPTGNGPPVPTFIKVGSPGGNVTPVNPANPTVAGDVEMQVDANGNPVPGAPPGVAKVKISIDGDNVTINKVGAYSGKSLPGYPVATTLKAVTQADGGLIYVDGGNVEVSGNVDSKLTVVAGASSDRPTVEALDPTAPNLIHYDANTANLFPNSVFLAPDNPIFNKGGTLTIPAIDSNGQPKWPAFDPAKLSDPSIQQLFVPGSNTDSSVTAARNNLVKRDDVTTREGNLTVTGDITATKGTTPAVGLLAQNFVLLSDQSSSNTLNVQATLESLGHSVQWGGFTQNTSLVAQTNPPVPVQTNYLTGFGLSGAGPPQPANLSLTHANNGTTDSTLGGTFNLTGSILGPYLDNEGTFDENSKTFLGYTVQNSKIDQNTENNPPPFLPNFNHTNTGANKTRICEYKIETIVDQSALQAH